MSGNVVSQDDRVNDGSDATFEYSFEDVNGDPVTVAQSIQYKLSDKDSTLIDWTSLPTTAPGEVTIDGVYNRISYEGREFRELAFFVKPTAGQEFTVKKTYTLVNLIGVTPTSPTP